MTVTLRHPRSRFARVTAIGAVGFMAASLAACSSSGAATNEDGQTVLTVYGWKGSDTEPANIAQINDAFEAAHPDIDVQYEYVPANDAYNQRVQPELLAGDTADVIMTDASKVQTWGEAGYLEPLTGDWTSTVLPELTPFISYEDDVYAAPQEVIGIDLYANRAVLAEAGVTDVPTTWPEFEDALAKTQAAGFTPLSIPNKNGWTGASTINAIAATKVYQDNPDWDEQFLAGDASFSDWKESVEQFVSLDEQGFVDFQSSLGVDEWSQGLPNFTAGKTAFWVQGAWNQTSVAAADIDSAFVPWPAGDEGDEPTVNLFVGTMLSITSTSKVKEAAAEYIEFWADPTNATPYVEAENAISPYTGGTTPTTSATEDFVAAFDEGRYRILPTTTWFALEGEQTMQQQTQSLMLGDLNVDAYLSALDEALRPSN
ncbi:extracellular solute-binding protein [Clavibacter michiganensis]|nr:extracellular solute-binding protein [Clavibacter michiganensis]